MYYRVDLRSLQRGPFGFLGLENHRGYFPHSNAAVHRVVQVHPLRTLRSPLPLLYSATGRIGASPSPARPPASAAPPATSPCLYRRWCRRSRHFNVLVLPVVGARIGTCIGTPLWRGCHALVSALQGERAAIALRGNVTGGPRGSPPPPSSSPPFGRRGWRRWWRWGRGCRGGRSSYAPGRDDGV